MELLLNILRVILALLAAAAVGTLIFFKLTAGLRDSRRRWAEKRVGQGARKALLLYQPSNARRNVPQAEALAARLAEMGYAVTVNHPSEDLPYAPGDYDLLVFGTPRLPGGDRPAAAPVSGDPPLHRQAGAAVCGRPGPGARP